MSEGEELACPECRFAGTLDDFDCCGLPNGWLYCNKCGFNFINPLFDPKDVEPMDYEGDE